MGGLGIGLTIIVVGISGVTVAVGVTVSEFTLCQ